jgi:RNA polymerase sigma-70 factor (ECF subfamily)
MAPAAGEHDLAAESDDELLRRIAERDLGAFRILYSRYARPIYGVALRRLGDRAEAEAATGRALAAIRRAAATYVPGDGGAAPWLFAVVRGAIDEHAADEEGWPAFRVHAAVAELPEQERAPVELAYWEGRSPGEIAELLGLPLGTVETRTRSALAHLAVRLGEP